MNKYTDLIMKYRLGEMSIAERKEFNRILCLNLELRKEFIFQEKLDKVMKNSLLLDSIESDPNLIKAEIMACRDIDNYWNKGVGNKDHKMPDIDNEVAMRKEIARAQVEMVLSGIDDISESWVRKFDEHKPFMDHDLAALKIKDYIRKSDETRVVEMPAAPARYRINRKVGFQLAAAVLVMAVLFFKTLTPSYNGDTIYKRYYQPMESNSYSLRGNSQTVAEKFSEGVDYYMHQEYSKADIAFDALRKSSQATPEVLLYSGLNKMGQGHFAAAITTLNELLAGSDQFVPEAQWYLGLCYIKTGENLKARSLMETLAQTEGVYKAKAQVILKNLNR